jgi:cold shock CspA family protein
MFSLPAGAAAGISVTFEIGQSKAGLTARNIQTLA